MRTYDFICLTLLFGRRIISVVKRITEKQNGFWKRALINIPFVLMCLLMTVCFGGGVLFVFYCFVTAAAFKSAMISLVLLGAGLILIGAGLGLIIAFRRYYKFYDKQMGWQYPGRAVAPREETSSVDGKKPLKAYFTLSNISLAILAVGAVFTIISAALGCISRDSWVDAIGPYREAHGYLADVQRIAPEYHDIIDQSSHQYTVEEIDLNLISKEAVIIFTDDQSKLGMISVEAYISYNGQLSIGMSGGKILTVTERPAPDTEKTALDKLLFFANDILRSVPSEKQIHIYLPAQLRDTVRIVGDHIVAK